MPGPPGAIRRVPTASTGYSAAPDGPDAPGSAGGGGPGGRSWGVASVQPRRCVRRLGPAQRPPVNRVRVGRQQLSAGQAVCRSQPGRRTERRGGPPSDSPEPGRVVRPSPTRKIRPLRPVGSLDVADASGRHPLPVAVPTVPAVHLRRGPRPGPRGAGPPQRRAGPTGGPRLPLQRAPGDGQDLHRPDPGQGAQLHRPAGRRTLRGLRLLPRDHQGHLPRRPRARRRLQQRGGGHA